MLVSAEPRDGLAVTGTAVLERLAAGLRDEGLTVKCRAATSTDVRELGSTWARRLGIPEQRSAWLLEARWHCRKKFGRLRPEVKPGLSAKLLRLPEEAVHAHAAAGVELDALVGEQSAPPFRPRAAAADPA